MTRKRRWTEVRYQLGNHAQAGVFGQDITVKAAAKAGDQFTGEDIAAAIFLNGRTTPANPGRRRPGYCPG